MFWCLFMTFAQKLDRLMRLHGESQRALAAAIDVSHPSVGAWLRDTLPHRSTALLIAEHYGVPVDSLLDDSLELPFDRAGSKIQKMLANAEASFPGNPQAQEQAFDSMLDEDGERQTVRLLVTSLASALEAATLLRGSDDSLIEIAKRLKDWPKRIKP